MPFLFNFVISQLSSCVLRVTHGLTALTCEYYCENPHNKKAGDAVARWYYI